MKGMKLRTIVGLFCLVLCAAGVLVAHVWKQNAYVRLSMSTMKIGKQRAQLRNDIALLEISVGGLKRLSRLESMAKARFGLEFAKAPVLVYLESDASGNGGRSDAAEPARGFRPERQERSAVREEPEGPGLEAGKVAWRIKGY